MELKGIAAIVTGGASGLGAATVELFAAAGARVAIFDVNDRLGAEVAGRVNGIFIKVDITSEEQVANGLLAAEGHHGVARILVNCAGIGAAAKTTSQGRAHSLAAFRKVIDINLVGTFNCIANFATRALAGSAANGEERGVVINTASAAAFDGQVGQAAYAASKAGIVGMTLPIARDLADKAIRVVTIAPGLFHTPLFDGAPPEVVDSLVRQTLFPRRLGSATEFAQMARAVVENPMLNAETIRLDGGIRMMPR